MTHHVTPTVGSLFSGIGGLDLGLERAGFRILWQCEADPYARRVLARHWPDVPCYPDVRALGCDVPAPDVLCGGFPCQPVSVAGKQLAEADPRWLWPAFARAIRLLRPAFVLLENVPRLVTAGLGNVLGDLAACGFDAEWDCLPAVAFGSWQRRDRLFVVAYRPRVGCEAGHGVFNRDVGRGLEEQARELAWLPRLERGASGRVWPVPDAGLHGMADGVPDVVDRLRCLGNAVVPQVAEWIGWQLRDLLAGQLPRKTSGTGTSTPSV